jgi:Ca2+-binding RTX toxin-like protein
MREGTRRRAFRVLASISLAFGAIVVAAPEASAAPLCAADTANHALTVTPQSTAGITLKASSPYLSVNDVFCALLNDVDTVTVDMTPYPQASVTFDPSGGPFAPGYTVEADGTSEIEFKIQGWSGTGNAGLLVKSTSGADGYSFGQFLNKITGTLVGQVNLNALVETSPDVDVSFGTPFPPKVYVYTGGGNDVVTGAGLGTIGSAAYGGSMQIYDEGGGNDQITGGSGNDTIVPTLDPSGVDVWSGGAGIDTLSTNTSDGQRASISLDDIANDGLGCPFTCPGDNARADIENVNGGGADDTITGNDANNVLVGGGGTNTLKGGGGNDTFTYTYFGGPVFTERYRGGSGRDTVSYEGVIDGSSGGVTVTIDGLPNDGLPNQGSNVGTDVEVVIGSPFSDLLTGSPRSDTLMGLAGADDLRGLDGSDTILPGPDADSVAGGVGSDTISYADATMPLQFNAPNKRVIGFGTDTYTGIEAFIGGSGADLFTGAAAGETFRGGDGTDTIRGGDGDDFLYGQKGDDGIDGGAGTDTCAQGPGAGSIVNCEA